MRNAALLFFCLLLSTAARSQKRFALVIGNARYTSEDTLKNPVNDVRLLTKKLTDCGFEVIAKENLGHQDFETAIDDFYAKIKAVNCVALFFYSGHGIQHEGENYLIPVNADIRTPADIQYQSIALSEILNKLRTSKSNTNIVILDACRKDPWSRNWAAKGGGEKGLKIVANAPPQTYIAFATGPDQIANDGTRGNSPFSLALSKYITEPNSTVEQVFKKVSREVRSQYPEQIPWIEDASDVDFYFTGITPNTANTSNTPPKPGIPAAAADDLVALSFFPTADCKVYIDDEYLGSFNANGYFTVKRNKGQHAVKAVSITDATVSFDTVCTFSTADEGAAATLPLLQKMFEKNQQLMAEMQRHQNDLAARSASANREMDDAVNSIKYDMVLIDGGDFMMGSTEGSNDESPVHKVTLKSYYLCKHEVTQAQWQAIMGNQPSQNKGCANCPVEDISWFEARQFVDKLNKLTGELYMLPTEAQWEYAARGGNFKTARSTKLEKYGWFYENGEGKTHPIGLLPANEKGICDMNGNVAEWCGDWYDNTYYRSSKTENPTGPDTPGKERSLRGGSFDDFVAGCRVTARFHAKPDQHIKSIGFRLARAVP